MIRRLQRGLRLMALATGPALIPMVLRAQIRVNPTGVSVNAMNPTTVFLSFGGLGRLVPTEAVWCGNLVPAIAPDRGVMCDPATIFGRLPARSALGQLGTGGAFTDIMSIPASVARRAFQSATATQSGTFFYVRRFAAPTGGASEFVAVTCRLTGGGANVPFSLTNVTVAFEHDATVPQIVAGELPPSFTATIAYTGSGQLRGRWEVVRPGEALPERSDLLTESSLPLAERGQQTRYTLLDRFNLTVLPTGQVVVPGPDPARLPHDVAGSYVVLLRIESTDELAGQSDLAAAGAGTGLARNGAVAGFPMPTLRYVIVPAGTGERPATDARTTASRAADRGTDRARVRLRSPSPGATWPTTGALTVSWDAVDGAAFYRVEFDVLRGGARAMVLTSALVRAAGAAPPQYTVPPLLREQADDRPLQWRVTALTANGATLARSGWRVVRP